MQHKWLGDTRWVCCSVTASGVTRGSCARGQELNFAPPGAKNFRISAKNFLMTFFLLFHFIFQIYFSSNIILRPPVLLPDKKHVFLVFISHIFLQFLYFSYKKIVRNPNFAPPLCCARGRPPPDPPRYATGYSHTVVCAKACS